jgi:hypothetical protein
MDGRDRVYTYICIYIYIDNLHITQERNVIIVIGQKLGSIERKVMRRRVGKGGGGHRIRASEI